ncbi:ATP-binding cassette domain-containing protein [Flammeovirga sp. EKP202]|uniref:ATP-binding cassette domain-containing protein n=1 Tax=Flammeovirga sp. EKP202 TaxID=2770592 RepID=UPI00165F2C4A|nr:ATP-binding cassette domain-containing protein [Flammeovirga sp. EKP202]MBD0399968.1 ATP-binding cassette domain-containing protein [Flammeovirga sp. EKP202]
MLELKNISFAYGEKQVLQNINISIEKGKIIGVLGKNGVGKTTLFEIIAQWKKNFNGETLLENETLLRAQVGYLEAKPTFYSMITGREHLNVFKVRFPDFDIDGWNSIFELPLDEIVDYYSTGMKKRLALMMLLSADVPVILLDEPFLGLDVEASIDLEKIINTLKERGKIILIASHTLSALQKLSDKIYHFSGGKVEQTFDKESFDELDGYMKEYFSNNHQDIVDKLL